MVGDGETTTTPYPSSNPGAALLHPPSSRATTEAQSELQDSRSGCLSAAATSESAAADTCQRDEFPKAQKVRAVAAPRFVMTDKLHHKTGNAGARGSSFCV